MRRAKENKVTKFGGSAVLIQYLGGVLNFRRRFSSVTIQKGKNSEFSTGDMLFSLLAIMMVECERISQINVRFKGDELLARQLGIKRIFAQATANRFLKLFQKWHIKQLERVLYSLIQEHSKFPAQGDICLDIDASILTLSSHHAEGAKPGRNKNPKGKASYSLSCGVSNHQVISAAFESGNTHCSHSVYTIFSKALQVLHRREMLRVDAGYISVEFLNWLLSQTVSATSTVPLKFLVACNGNAKGVKEAKAYAREHPEKWGLDKEAAKEIYVLEFKHVQLFEKYPEGVVRLVLVKMRQKVKKCKKKKVRYHTQERIYAIATNLHRGYGARKIFKKYHQRQTSEARFKELKNACKVGKLPTGKMKANYAYFLMCCLAYNTSYYFKRDVLPSKYQNNSMKTLRKMFFEIPAYYHDVWDVEANPTYRYIGTYRFMINRVERLKSTTTSHFY